MPQQEFMGFSSIDNLKGILSEHRPRRIFLVTGKESYEKSGAKSAIGGILESCEIVHFCDFGVNPNLQDIEKGIQAFKKNDCGLVMAIGGGSVIDTAKATNILACNEGSSKDIIIGNKIKKKGKPLVAIPTTSGSGSEATKFAVVYVGKSKYSLDHETVLPDYAIVDPQFTMHLPKRITASSGMDALCQAVESYWCVNSTDASKRYAKEAIRLIMENIVRAVNTPDRKSKEAMSNAAHLAGKAINITRTTACHAISYPMTSHFNVPHGHAVALTLGKMLAYNSNTILDDVLDSRGVAYVRDAIKEIVSMLGCGDAKGAEEKISRLMAQIGLETKLGDLGIRSDDDIERVIKNGFNPSRVRNNPRILTEPALREILNSIR